MTPPRTHEYQAAVHNWAAHQLNLTHSDVTSVDIAPDYLTDTDECIAGLNVWANIDSKTRYFPLDLPTHNLGELMATILEWKTPNALRLRALCLTIECPLCHAQPQQPCQYSTGYERPTIHSQRLTTALRAQADNQSQLGQPTASQ